VRDRLTAALLPALADIEAGVVRLDRGAAVVAVGPGEPDAPRASAILASVHELRRALDSVAEGLYPAFAGERGLVHAIQQAAERCPVTTTVTAAGLEPQLDQSVAATAWYVCSEALTNVAKHAQASRARVKITMGDGRLVVLVEDDGIGGVELAAGSGLRGLADRIEAMGGTLRVEPARTGSGTRVMAHLPVTAAE